MPFDDLAKALSIFNDGVQSLQVSRSIAAANEQVNQIRATETNESNKRAQLQSVANNVVAQMAGLGVPATTIQQVSGAFTPQKFNNAADMFREGSLENNSQLKAMGRETQMFEEDPLNKRLAAQMSAMGLKSEKTSKADQEKTRVAMTKLATRADPSAKAKGAPGILALNIQRLEESKGLSYENADIMRQNLAELPLVISTVLGGGQGSEHTNKTLSPDEKSIKARASKLLEQVTGNPQLSGQPEFVAEYNKTIDRLLQIGKAQLGDQIRGVFASEPLTVALDPKAANSSMKALLNRYGIDDDLEYDADSSKVKFQSDATKAELTKALEHILSMPDRVKAAQAYEVINDKMGDKIASISRTNSKLGAKIKQFRIRTKKPD